MSMSMSMSACVPQNLQEIGICQICFGDRYTKKMPVYKTIGDKNVLYFIISEGIHMRVLPNPRKSNWELFRHPKTKFSRRK